LLEHVFQKFSEGLVAEYTDMFFLALVIVNANDDSEKCRNKAGTLLQILISRYDDNKLQELVSTLGKWVAKRAEDPALARSAAVVAGLTLQAVDADQRQSIVRTIRQSMNDIVVDSAENLRRAEEVAEEQQQSAFEPEVDLDHSLPFQALTTLARCLDSGALDQISWNDVVALLLFPHDWVRLAAAKTVGAGLAKDASLLDSEQLGDVARKCCLILTGHRSKDGSRTIANEKLCTQVVKLLFFIGKAWAVSTLFAEMDLD
jgi:U3 small nucleolar RNA-associated protein 20